ncbi:MAG: RnfABCDGE type electron transport complex subunit D [Desulfobacterales bacterium]|jgi:Na+-translocating ferredoxin:NAD+ oxidoreductase subunit D
MNSPKKFIVSHAPFWHYGSNVGERSYHTIFAALPAVLLGIFQYGLQAMAVAAFSVSTAILWELAFTTVAKRPKTIGDGNAALIGLLLAMMMPATTPWWAVLTSTFVAIVIAKQIFGGLGGNSFNPVVLTLAIVTISWKGLFNFDAALVNIDLGFIMFHPLVALKAFGTSAVANFSIGDLLLGRQVGGIGSTFGLGLIIGGIYLILRGFIRWEISVSFLVGILVSAAIFHMADPTRFASPMFHLLTGYTLIGAFFLATEDSSSPVNFIPMLIYGASGGIVTVMIRSIGTYADGVIYAILVINLVNPLIDKLRPKALGKVV